LSVAPAADLALKGGRLTGRLRDVPWGRHATGIVAVTGGAEPTLLLLDPRQASISPKQNVAGEARDDLDFDSATPLAVAPLPAELTPDSLWLGGALLRSGQSAGALEAALALSVQYATERVQFGKPIAAFHRRRHFRRLPLPRPRSVPPKRPASWPVWHTPCTAPSASPTSMRCSI
jgi:acyl-CoA dehydrogenase